MTFQGRSQRFYHVEAHQNIWRIKGYSTLQIANNKGTDQTAGWSVLLLFAINIKFHMMLKPRAQQDKNNIFSMFRFSDFCLSNGS